MHVSGCAKEREARENLCVYVDGGRVSLKNTLFKAYMCVCVCVCRHESVCVCMHEREREVR